MMPTSSPLPFTITPWTQPEQLGTSTDHVKVVHLFFKTHLDVGFTNFAVKVIDQYLNVFFPAAIQTAHQLRESGGAERLTWCTGSWLIYEFLERATKRDREAMEKAILAGDIVWHALPFTLHSEMMDAPLFEFGLNLSQALDVRFGTTTIAAKMSDVPGHTRAIIPILARAGIRFLHIGVNPGSPAPNVPSLFVWRHNDHAQGPSDIIVLYDKLAYGLFTVLPQLEEALAIAHGPDNWAPPQRNCILSIYRTLRNQFPKAEIRPSRLDAFAAALAGYKDQLPVITSEIGDTWIHGIGSDPLKVSGFRALSRLRANWLDTPHSENNQKALHAFSRRLLLVPEHTWGLDHKRFLPDQESYNAVRFRRLRTTPDCKRYESSWEEQRVYLRQAIEALGHTGMAAEARAALRSLKPLRPSTQGYQKVLPPFRFPCKHFKVGIDRHTGAINHLQENRTGRIWGTPKNPLGLFRYEIFSADDYDRYLAAYIRSQPLADLKTLEPDFTKTGLRAVGHPHMIWNAGLKEVYFKHSKKGEHIILTLGLPPQAVRSYGAPESVVVEIGLPTDRLRIEIELKWFNKPACRIAEASWYSFCPLTGNTGSWRLDKMGVAISPLEVVENGNRNLHAVQSGVTYEGPRTLFQIQTLDAPLVAPGRPGLLTFTNRQPVPERGMHFNLHNNVWGTNFRMWYDDDARFRFVVNFE